MTVVQIFLIRHGETALNAAGVLRGQLDVPLDDDGQAEALALGERFSDVCLSAVISSPLKRALDTARPVAKASGAPMWTDERLSDRFYGELAGQSIAQAAERFGSIDAAPLVEAWQLLEQRAQASFLEAASRAAGAPGAVALVTHDAVLRALLTLLVPELSSVRLDLATGSWSELQADSPAGPWKAPRIGQLPASGLRP
ncbi:MAG: histidine phosphatase family protein [Acidimicrobiales bacterium]|jgi:broad specificity phosphatase PhoE